jgi:ATP-dependent DNA helicase RecG
MDRIVSNCLESKNQAYWVCPLIEETENMNANNLLQVEKDFKQRYPNFPCAILHGKMKSNEKDEILNRFNKKEILLLIATTVIEVGVHVEDATIMVIENAERYGLAQLHQLRGRVGRGKNKSFCILLVKQDISQTSLERIKILAKTKDGFSIAEQDFKNRGGGSLFGENQSGRRMFKIADLYANSDILQSIQKHKKEIASSIDIASMSSVWIGENIDLANS